MKDNSIIYKPMSVRFSPDDLYEKVEIEVKFKDGNLSICGSIGKWCNGQIWNSLIKDHADWLRDEYWSKPEIDFLLRVWERWHLNYLRAGTPKQEEFIRQWRKENDCDYNFTQACEVLKNAGLYIDQGYKYGTECLKEDVPKEIIDKLFNLPWIFGEEKPVILGDQTMQSWESYMQII